MKRFVVFFFCGYFFIGILFSLGFGYYFHSVLQRAGANSYSDFIKNVNSAYLANEGIQLCLDGAMAGGKLNTFSLIIPLNKLLKGDSSVEDAEIIYSDFDKNIVELSRNHLHSGCANNLYAKSMSLPVLKIELKNNYSVGRDESVERIVEENIFDLAIYEVTLEGATNKKIPKRILLVSKKPILENSKYIFIKISDEKKRGGVQWYAVLPFAILMDAAIFPYQIYKWLIYAEAH